MKINRKTVLSIAYTLLFLPGVAACFLPFTFDISPFDVLFEVEPPVGFPFILAIPILWAKARAVITSRIKKFEITAFYLSAVIALIADCYLAVVFWEVTFDGQYIPDWDDFLFFSSLSVPMIAGLAFFLAILRKRIPHNITSVICMELAWIFNTIFCVTIYWTFGRQIGAWTAIFAGAVYLVDIILLTRRGRHEAANEELSITNLH